jgi:hypothetical protein
VTRITYDSDDQVSIVLSSGCEGECELTLVQDGDHVQVVLDGKVVALLLDADADDISNASVSQGNAGKCIDFVRSICKSGRDQVKRAPRCLPDQTSWC